MTDQPTTDANDEPPVHTWPSQVISGHPDHVSIATEAPDGSDAELHVDWDAARLLRDMLTTLLVDWSPAEAAAVKRIAAAQPGPDLLDVTAGGFWPDMTGGLCSVCHIDIIRGDEDRPDPDHPDCVRAFDAFDATEEA